MKLAFGVGVAAVVLVALAFAVWAPHGGVRRAARWAGAIVLLGALLAWALEQFAGVRIFG